MPPKGKDKKAKKPKLPVKKTVEKEIAALEAAAADRRQVRGQNVVGGPGGNALAFCCCFRS